MSKRRGNFLLLGALIGFIAGLFFAPKKGSELRRDIDDNFAEDDNIHISEDEIVISRTFSDEGDNK